jgi:2-polyprenyl-6-methoxyphenol hydroxylase-like FAD-dependent oxidoreductase
MTEQYDVIVVGARCAGASTALLLSRRGHRVLLLDRAAFGSDLPMSTHLVWPRGVAQLAEWGLLDELADSGCPPLPTARMDFGELVLEGPLEPAGEVTAAYAPRRAVLDGLLVDAAAAGAHVRERSTVESLLNEGDRCPATALIATARPGHRRTLIARATTRAMVARAIADCTSMSILVQRESGRVSVGLKAVVLV